ncbi:MAG: hypothetical protein AAFX87_27255 [Bacteroidota bacterium]
MNLEKFRKYQLNHTNKLIGGSEESSLSDILSHESAAMSDMRQNGIIQGNSSIRRT